MKWEDYKHEFEFDGSWRDIYVLNTGLADWQLVIDLLKTDIYEPQFNVDGDKAIFPLSVDEIFMIRNEASSYLLFKVDSIQLNCHFFIEAEIEFDFDPREIKSEFDAQRIFNFMRRLGVLLNKEVILTPENWQEYLIFTFSPLTDEIKYIVS